MSWNSTEEGHGRKRPGGDGALYRALLDALPQKIFLKDKSSTYLLCNEAYARDLELRPEDLEGRTDLEFFPRELAEKYRADDRRTMAAGVPEEFDEEYVSGGEKRVIHTVKTPVRDAGGLVTGVLGIFWDVTDNVKAQEALRESEAMFRSLFTQVSDLVLLLDVAPEGIPLIRDVSDSVEKLLGYSRQELVGRPVSILDPELVSADPARAAEVLRRRREAAMAGRSFIVKHPCKDGTTREFECAANIRTAGRAGVAISVERDITERRKTETELRFRAALLDNATDAIHALELDGRIIYVNETVIRSTGYSRDELLGMSVSKLDSSDDASLAPARIKELISAGSGRFRMLRLRKDGSSFPVEAYARVVELEGKKFIIAVDRDITDRERAEAELRESYETQHALNAILQQALAPLPLQKKLEEHLSSLFSIPWLAVEPKGAVFLASGRTLLLTAQHGLAPELLKACSRLPFGKCLCGRAAESGELVASSCVDSGHEISYDDMPQHGHYCAPISAGGKVLGVLNLYLKSGVEIDGKRLDFLRAVTDILAADILRARAEEQLVHSQKMDAIGHMAGGVAHDFNNILSAIMGYASFLRAGIPDKDPKRADVEEIYKAGERAAELTRQLLAFSRKQAVQSEPLDLDQIVPETVKMVRRMVSEEIEFSVSLGSAPARVLGNRGQIEQVLVNLAVNARDAMPSGGRITFETAQVELDEGYAAANPDLSPGRYVMIAVSDTGSGMSPDVLQHIFEPFFTTKEPGKGTGLGLATVYGIVRQSGGGMYVYSEPGFGSTFKLYFPVSNAAAAGHAEQKKISSERGTETVLLVDDDDSIRKFVSRLLAQNGYTVLEAATPKSALELCSGRKDISLLLTDMVMPQMNGYTLAKAAAELLPAIKVIFMSGYTENAMTRREITNRGMVLLEKPIISETLLRKLREVMDQ